MNRSKVLAVIGIILLVIQAVVSVITTYTVCKFGVLPDKYRSLMLVLLIITFLVVVVTQFFRIINIPGKLISVAMIVILVYTYFAVDKVNTTINKVNASSTAQVSMSVAVVKNSSYASIEDLKTAIFGITTDAMSYEYDLQALDGVNNDLGVGVTVIEYADDYALAKALFKGEIDAMIYNAAYASTIDEAFYSAALTYQSQRETLSITPTPNLTGDEEEQISDGSLEQSQEEDFQDEELTDDDVDGDENDEEDNTDNEAEDVEIETDVLFDSNGEIIESFSDNIKEIKAYSLEVQTVANSTGFAQTTTDRELIDTTSTPFVVYISGIDVEGPVSTVSRSDVNVLVAVNPVTKQIAMVTTPRDAYVEIPGITDDSNLRDKLTHAGLYGSSCEYSIATLEKVYGVNIDYYVRVNFTSVVNIVDLLGGVSVYSAHDFTERWAGKHFNVGYNDVNGREALHFARERYTIEGGDYSRGRNHVELVKAVLNKCMTPAILTNYSALLDEIADNFETNMTKDEIVGIVRMQLGDGASWNYASAAAEDGDGQVLRYTYSYTGSKLYVSILTQESVQKCSYLLEQVLNGEIVESDVSQ
jgi:LCP family protein required for cell wall assembly